MIGGGVINSKLYRASLYLFLIFWIFLFCYSFFWVDPNLTLISYPKVALFFDRLRRFGFFQRDLAANQFLIIILGLFLLQIYFLFSRLIKRVAPKTLITISLGVILLATFSYPFLSHDIFNYLFVAKTILFYHQNPYLVPPQSLAPDLWLRFMHWVHATTPYGPVWVFYSLIPALFSLGKFSLNLFWWKTFDGVLFFITGWLLFKILDEDRIVFPIWFFNPFLLLELLVNAHNELLMIFLLFLGLYWLKKNKKQLALITTLASILTKYISLLWLPAMFLPRKKWKSRWLWLALFFVITAFVIKAPSFQSWYLSWVFMFLPFLSLKKWSWAMTFGLEFLILVDKYYPFLKSGYWRTIFPSSLLALFFIFWGASLAVIELRK